MPINRAKTWYLCALSDDPVTNKAIVLEVIGAQNFADNERGAVMCADRVSRNLVRCDYFHVKKALGATPEYKLQLEVLWGYEDGTPGLWKLWEKQVKSKMREHALAQKISLNNKPLGHPTLKKEIKKSNPSK